MSYTLAVQYHSHSNLISEPIAPFDGEAVGELWSDLGATDQQIKSTMTVTQAEKRYIPLMPEFPQLSNLLFIDEGVFPFRGSDIEELRLECMRAKKIVTGKQSVALIESLLEAAIKAQERSGEVITHPFGWTGLQKETLSTGRRIPKD